MGMRKDPNKGKFEYYCPSCGSRRTIYIPDNQGYHCKVCGQGFLIPEVLELNKNQHGKEVLNDLQTNG